MPLNAPSGVKPLLCQLMLYFHVLMWTVYILIVCTCRVLTVHGSADQSIPVQDAHEFAKIIPNHKLHIVEGADHEYTKHQTELVAVVLNFIKEGLKQN